MRCKRHTVDFSSSTNGVCASCLRERLLSLAASAAVTAAIEDNNNRNQSRKSNNPPPHPPLLIFPRSVSPYVTRRKSDAGTGTGEGRKDDPLTTSSNRRFITTPQVDLAAGYSCKDFESNRSHNKPKENKKNSSRFSNLFRARSEDFDPRFSSDASESSSSSSRSWISTMLSTGRRKKQPCYIEDVIAGRRPQRIYCRGMSPARDTETEAEPESLEELRSTPATTTTKTPGRRKVGNGIGKKSMSGMAFCLSPLVRASPNCPFKRRMRFPSEFGNSGSGEVTMEQEKPHISAAASFCANRSKKLVDLGRVDRRR